MSSEFVVLMLVGQNFIFIMSARGNHLFVKCEYYKYKMSVGCGLECFLYFYFFFIITNQMNETDGFIVFFFYHHIYMYLSVCVCRIGAVSTDYIYMPVYI